MCTCVFVDRSTFLSLLASYIAALFYSRPCVIDGLVRQCCIGPEGSLSRKKYTKPLASLKRCERIFVAVLPVSGGEGNGDL